MFDRIRSHDFCTVFGIDRFIFAGLTMQRIMLIMFMYSWRFAKLISSTVRDHIPYLVWLDADLCKLALYLISFRDQSAVRLIHNYFCEIICKMATPT